MLRRIAPAALLAVIGLLAPTPAAAADHELAMAVTYTTTGVGPVTFACHAIATGHTDTAFTRIDACTFNGSAAPTPVGLRGPYAATAGVATPGFFVPVCVAGYALWSDAHEVTRPLTCRDVLLDIAGFVTFV